MSYIIKQLKKIKTLNVDNLYMDILTELSRIEDELIKDVKKSSDLTGIKPIKLKYIVDNESDLELVKQKFIKTLEMFNWVNNNWKYNLNTNIIECKTKEYSECLSDKKYSQFNLMLLNGDFGFIIAKDENHSLSVLVSDKLYLIYDYLKPSQIILKEFNKLDFLSIRRYFNKIYINNDIYELPAIQTTDYELSVYQNLKKLLLNDNNLGFFSNSNCSINIIKHDLYEDQRIYNFINNHIFEYNDQDSKWEDVGKIKLDYSLYYNTITNKLFLYKNDELTEL